MKNEIKSTKLRAGRYQVSIKGFQPFIVQERLNNNCMPTGEWNMFAPDGEWMDTLPTKSTCLWMLGEMHKGGRLDEYRLS